MKTQTLNTTISIYIPLQQAVFLSRIGEAARRRPSQLVLQCFTDNSILLGLESGAISWHDDVSESTKEEWDRSLARLINRSQAMMKLKPERTTAPQEANTQ